MKITNHIYYWFFLKTIVIAALISLFFLWHPWLSTTKQTLTISGESVITHPPDSFLFSPTYQKKAGTSNEAISQVSELGNSVVAKLKEFGLSGDDLTSTVSVNPSYEPVPLQSPSTAPAPKEFVASYAIQATAHTTEVAQKILSYLATTPAEGTITPSLSFSDTLRLQLEKDARAAALQQAKDKADQTVQALHVHLGNVQSVTESNPFQNPIVYRGIVAPLGAESKAPSSPDLNIGTQKLTFTVTVIYQID